MTHRGRALLTCAVLSSSLLPLRAGTLGVDQGSTLITDPSNHSLDDQGHLGPSALPTTRPTPETPYTVPGNLTNDTSLPTLLPDLGRPTVIPTTRPTSQPTTKPH